MSFFASGFAEILFIDYDAANLGDEAKKQLMINFLSQILSWKLYLDSVMRYAVDIFPIFAVLSVISFGRFGEHNEKNQVEFRVIPL